jgi:hypothetical protein
VTDDETVPLPQNPLIDIEKSTNGFDADAAPGPEILAGADVTWEYLVTNTGNVTLSGVSVSDDQGVTVSCPQATLAVGASMTCTASGTAQAGQYANEGTADATSPLGASTSDMDPSHYFGATPSVDVEKSTNGYDANASPGPEILAGEAVLWEYVVTNDGNVDLTGIVVTDDVLGTICTVDLAAGASTTCTASGTAAAGQYENIGTASFSYTDDSGNTASGSADDPSHYFGANPAIAIEKTTADDYGNEGDGIGILPGENVTWNYYVTNTGNVPLTDVTVTDDQGVAVSCPQDILAVGESMTCTASGIAAEGWYNNIGTADSSYTDDFGNTATPTDQDDSSYYGLTPGAVTDSSLCDFGDQFNLIFTPDFQSGNNRYKLSDSNPGQFFYNLFYVADGSGEVTIEVPYPFVTQGGNPIHAYGGLFVTPETGNGTNCFDPRNELYNSSQEIVLGDYTGYGDTYILTVSGLPTSGFVYLNLHLDYGLEKTKGWEKSRNDALNDPEINPELDGVDILHLTDHTFDSSIPDSTDTVQNNNVFKRIRGIGGLVQEEIDLGGGSTTIEPIEGITVEVRNANGDLLDTATTDEDGWYFFLDFRHKGKAATYTVSVPSLGVSDTATLGRKVKYQQVDFLITP